MGTEVARLEARLAALVGEVEHLRAAGAAVGGPAGQAGGERNLAASGAAAAAVGAAAPRAVEGGAQGEGVPAGEAQRVRAAEAVARAGVGALAEVQPEFFADAEYGAPNYRPAGSKCLSGFAAAPITFEGVMSDIRVTNMVCS